MLKENKLREYNHNLLFLKKRIKLRDLLLEEKKNDKNYGEASDKKKEVLLKVKSYKIFKELMQKSSKD